VSFASPFLAGSVFLVANALLYRSFFQAKPKAENITENR